MLGAIGVKIQSMTECVDTIAKLKEIIPGPGMIPCVMVNGYHESGDGGGGSFLWDSVFNVDLTKFPEGEDLGIIIKPDSFSAPTQDVGNGNLLVLLTSDGSAHQLAPMITLTPSREQLIPVTRSISLTVDQKILHSSSPDG